VVLKCGSKTALENKFRRGVPRQLLTAGIEVSSRQLIYARFVPNKASRGGAASRGGGALEDSFQGQFSEGILYTAPLRTPLLLLLEASLGAGLTSQRGLSGRMLRPTRSSPSGNAPASKLHTSRQEGKGRLRHLLDWQGNSCDVRMRGAGGRHAALPR
jgi:hypothetical protein